jgi:tetratricopeptide (TPR) repeat protein
MFYSWIKASVFVLAFFLCSLACAGEIDCGPLTNHFGPFDYYTASPADRRLVERPHFPRQVEQLRKGNTGPLGQDISYTLSVFPNHPRALYSMSKLAIREKTSKPQDSLYSIDCWFDRAMRFRPDDSNVRMIYGIYLQTIGKSKEAVQEFNKAAEFGGDNGNLFYNLGLAYFDIKDYERALEYAHRADQLGYRLPGLKNKLVRVGKWREPTVVVDESEAVSPTGDPPVSPSSPSLEK